MNFGSALNILLVLDTPIRRRSWARTSFVYIGKGRHGIDHEYKDMEHIHAIPGGMFNRNSDYGISCRLPSLYQDLDDGTTLRGWTPSTIDLLADDWETWRVEDIRDAEPSSRTIRTIRQIWRNLTGVRR